MIETIPFNFVQTFAKLSMLDNPIKVQNDEVPSHNNYIKQQFHQYFCVLLSDQNEFVPVVSANFVQQIRKSQFYFNILACL